MFNNKLNIAVIWLVMMSCNTVHAGELLVGGSGTDISTMRILAKAFKGQNPKINIKVLPSLGSSGGVKALAKGHLHIGLTSRALKPKERVLPLNAYLYAKTPLVFATNKNNQADSLSSKTYFKALGGTRQFWPDGQLIRLVLRPMSDSDTMIINKSYPQSKATVKQGYLLKGIPIAATDQKAAVSLESIKGSLGTTTLSLIQSEKRSLKPLTLDNVAPSINNLANGSYPMSKSLYLLLPESPDQAAIQFTKFIQSEKGSEILRQTGHLPIPFKIKIDNET